MKIIIAAFEAFGKSKISSAEILAKALSEKYHLPVEILPVSYKRAEIELYRIVEQHRPEVLLMLGQAGGDRELRIENIAINMRDVNLADKDGYIAQKEIIDPDFQMTLFTKADVCSIRDEIRSKGIKAKRSNSAGLFVCNSTFFKALTLEKFYPNMTTIFVHLPILPQQQEDYPERFVMTLEDMIQGVELIIKKYEN